MQLSFKQQPSVLSPQARHGVRPAHAPSATYQGSTRYVSTRGERSAASKTFSEVLLEGLAPDGGLAVPTSFPVLGTKDLTELRGLSYAELAAEILGWFCGDIRRDVLLSIAHKTYNERVFKHPSIAPTRKLSDSLYLLRLSNGPTYAFKDFALQLLGNLFEHVLRERGQTLNILGATSGDTGSAAEHAMLGKRGIAVFMLSPLGKMSPFQRAQMYSLNDPNIHNLAIRGVFDDCQDIVKAVSRDAAFKSRYRIGAVNTINWARVVAQITYYFKSYFDVTKSDQQAISFSVPTGNFGNVLAGYIAKRMGLPIDQLILATNENDMLVEFFQHGHYRVRSQTQVHETSSPSMDISKASNFERFIYDIADGDGREVAQLWDKVEQEGGFEIGDTRLFARVKQSGLIAGRCSHQERILAMRGVYEQFGIYIDPHTANAVHVGLKHAKPDVPLVCLETAHPMKFEDAVKEAVGSVPPREAGCEGIELLPQGNVITYDVDKQSVMDYVARHAVLSG